MTRIVAGTRGGRRIVAPSGQATRPTSDRVREALFSTLAALTDLGGCRFVDLYAGSGAVGLEAASRGAAAVLLVEADPRAGRIVRDNIATLELNQTCRLVTTKVTTVLSGTPDAAYDVVFADPPYAVSDEEVQIMLRQLVEGQWLASPSVIVVERSSRSPEPAWPAGVTPGRSRRYGETTLWYGHGA